MCVCECIGRVSFEGGLTEAFFVGGHEREATDLDEISVGEGGVLVPTRATRDNHDGAKRMECGQ